MMIKMRNAPGVFTRYIFYAFAAILAFVLAYFSVGTASKYLLFGNADSLTGVAHADIPGGGPTGTSSGGTACAAGSGGSSGTGPGGTDGGCSSGTASGTSGSCCD